MTIHRVIFDTDIGIDDAMALLFLHYSENVQLLAITTTAGNASVSDTTRNARYVCRRFGITQVPIYQGTEKPLGPAMAPPDTYPDFVHGRNGLGDIELVDHYLDGEDNKDKQTDNETSNSAAQAIVDLVRQYPNQITIVAVGRLTNLAAAMEIYDNSYNNKKHHQPLPVKKIVCMGGCLLRDNQTGNVSPVAEANMAGDPVAADLVLGSGADVTLVGLDVTQQVLLDQAFFAQLVVTAGDAGAFVHEIVQCYLNHYQRITGIRSCPMHDSSAVAFLLAPDLFAVERGPVRVVTSGIAMGQTILGWQPERYLTDAWRNGRPTSCAVATRVEADAVKQLYLDTLARAVVLLDAKGRKGR